MAPFTPLNVESPEELESVVGYGKEYGNRWLNSILGGLGGGLAGGMGSGVLSGLSKGNIKTNLAPLGIILGALLGNKAGLNKTEAEAGVEPTGGLDFAKRIGVGMAGNVVLPFAGGPLADYTYSRGYQKKEPARLETNYEE